jgi:hypothetical protein
MTRETVAVETPASAATSFSLGSLKISQSKRGRDDVVAIDT